MEVTGHCLRVIGPPEMIVDEEDRFGHLVRAPVEVRGGPEFAQKAGIPRVECCNRHRAKVILY